jgi:hypothetical protein
MTDTAIAGPLQIIRQACKPQVLLSEDALWRAITNSIRMVANQLAAWGQVFNGSSPTDEQTVREAATALQQFDNQLIELDSWLTPRLSLRWAQLQNQLGIARETHWNPSIKSAWDMYVEWETDKRRAAGADVQTQKWYKEQRRIAGGKIVTFAYALKDAISIAETYPL